MNASKLVFAFAMLTVASAANARNEKILVCHVGNEVGPHGETFLDDPYCAPSDVNDYFCPDAGKIDLIVVPTNSNHLGNENHSWDSISDYAPLAMGATGEGTEDSDGNGVDDGCEIPSDCPCWAEQELQAVSASDNLLFSCDPAAYPSFVLLWAYPEPLFVAQSTYNDGQHFCSTDATGNSAVNVTPDQADICIAQLAQRCAEIGRPVVPIN